MSAVNVLAGFDNLMADFGVSVTLGAATFVGIFDDDYSDPLGIGGSVPMLVAYTSDTAAAAVGNAITVDGRAFTIVTIEDDGQGMTRLRLQESA